MIMSNNFNREPKRLTHSDAEVRRENSLDPTNVKHTSGSNSREEEIFLLVKMRATEVLTEAKEHLKTLHQQTSLISVKLKINNKI